MLKRIFAFFSLTVLPLLVFAAENTNPLASPFARIGMIVILLLVCVFGVKNMQKHKKAAQGSISSDSSFSASFSGNAPALQLTSQEQVQYDKYKQYVKTYKSQYSEDQLRKALSDQSVSTIWIDQIFREV